MKSTNLHFYSNEMKCTNLFCCDFFFQFEPFAQLHVPIGFKLVQHFFQFRLLTFELLTVTLKSKKTN